MVARRIPGRVNNEDRRAAAPRKVKKLAYNDLRDFQPEYAATVDGLNVQVEKLGGGVPGRVYDGTWRYIVADASGTELARGQDFVTGMPKTHAAVAETLAELIGERD